MMKLFALQDVAADDAADGDDAYGFFDDDVDEQEGEQERLHAVDVTGCDWRAKAVLWKCTKNRHGEQRDMQTAFTGKRQLFIPIASPAEEFDEFRDHAPCGSGR